MSRRRKKPILGEKRKKKKNSSSEGLKRILDNPTTSLLGVYFLFCIILYERNFQYNKKKLIILNLMSILKFYVALKEILIVLIFFMMNMHFEIIFFFFTKC